MSQWAVGNRRRQRRRSVKTTLSANTLAYGTAPSRGAHTDYDAVLRDEFWDSILATYRALDGVVLVGSFTIWITTMMVKIRRCVLCTPWVLLSSGCCVGTQIPVM